MTEKEEKKQKPFYKTKVSWLEVAKIAAQAAIVYYANKGKSK